MAYVSYDKIWPNEIYNNVSAKDREQGVNFIQLKLKVNDVYKKDDKIALHFKPYDNSNVINKAYLDEKKIKNRESGNIIRN